MVVTNLYQDTAGRRRWRDAGAVGMGEDAMRREPLSNHGNSPAERFWERDLNDFAYCVLNPSLLPQQRLACRMWKIAGEESRKMSFAVDFCSGICSQILIGYFCGLFPHI